MQLTEQERDLLVDTLIESLWQFPLEGTHRSVREMIVHKAIMPTVEGVLADRAVPEPDAADERAAKALCDFDVESNGGYRWEDRSDEWDSDYEYGRNHYRDMARAALAAAGDDLDAIDDLAVYDILIDHCFNSQGKPNGYEARMLADDNDCEPVVVAAGTGVTRKAAVLDAVAKAKVANDDTH